MENENLQQPSRGSNARSVRDILFILRKNIALMLAVFFIILGIGAVYTLVANEGYTSQELVNLDIKNQIDDGQQGSVSDLTRPNVNTISKWRYTIMDFCSSGVVLDRADFYYSEYEKCLENGDVKDVDDFVDKFSTLVSGGKVETYAQQNAKDVFNASKINITGADGEDPETFSTFFVNYVDNNAQEAEVKVRILVLAYKEEVQLKDNNLESKYFGGMEVYLTSYGHHKTFSNKKIFANIIVTVMLGVVLALVSVYLKTVLDNTIKAKEDLENITGASVFAAIENKE